jgi:tape measure domain-containing protein
VADNTLRLVLEADASGAVKNIKTVNAELRGVEQVGTRAARIAGNEFSRFTQQALKLAGALGLVKAAGTGFRAAIDFEQARIGIEAFVGSAEKARQIFRDVQDLAIKSPLGFDELLVGTERLLAFRFSAEDLLPTLEAVSATVGAIGGQDKVGKMNDLITALGQIKAAGRLTGEEMRQLRNVGIPALEYVADAFGVSVVKMKKAISEGIVPGNEAVIAVVEGAQKQFGKLNEAVATKAGVSLSNLGDAFKKTADAILATQMPKLALLIRETLIPALESAASWFNENRVAIEQYGAVIGKFLLSAAVVAGIYKLTVAIQGLAAAFAVLRAATIANPVALVLAGIAGAAYLAYANVDRLKKRIDDLGDRSRAPLEPMGTFSDVASEFRVVRPGSSRPPFQFTANVEAQEKKVADAARRAREILQRAEDEQLRGIDRIIRERDRELAEYGRTAQARVDINKAAEIRIRAEMEKTFKDAGEAQRKVCEQWMDSERELLAFRSQAQADTAREIARLGRETVRSASEFRLREIEISRDAQLRAERQLGEGSVQERILFEARKAEIERAAALETLRVRTELIEKETQLRIEAEETFLRLAGVSENLIATRRDAMLRQSSERARQIAVETQAQITAVQEDAAIRQAEIARDAYQRQFDQLRQAAGSVFDALLTRTRSFGDAVRNVLRTALLTPLREFAASWVATMLAGNGGAGGRGVSPLGRIFGAAGIGIGGMGGGVGFPGAPGGTPGFAGPVQGMGAMGAVGGISGLGAGLGGALTRLGNLGAKQLGLGMPGFGIGGPGVYGKLGGGMLAGGGILAAIGLQRGGWSGLGMTTAGGALIGAKFGGPIGALIGAGIGFGAGLARLFFKGAESKAKEKIKAVYGVDLNDRGLLQQIVQQAKQQFGGNLDVAIRSPQIRDLIELYAMSTGQGVGPLARTVTPVSFVQKNGRLVQRQGFMNGSPIDQLAASAASIGNQSIVVKLDGPATTAVLRGEAVEAVAENPRTVQAAAMSALRSNFGRRQMLGLQVAPGTITN